MGSAITRLGDKTAGLSGTHAWQATPSDSGSPTIFINGKAAIRIGDHYTTHSMPNPPVAPHDAVSAQGSTTVFFNGLAVTRVNDLTSCTDKIAEGSPNVFAGG